MWTSPLLSTLKKVDIWSQALKEEAELQGQMRHQLGNLLSLQPLLELLQRTEGI